VAFADFQKAFDSVDRCILYEVLHTNFLMVTLKKLKHQYTDHSKVVLENIKVVHIYLIAQLVYGKASLSPVLFVLLIDNAYRLFSLIRNTQDLKIIKI